jgi:hypothetical protein
MGDASRAGSSLSRSAGPSAAAASAARSHARQGGLPFPATDCDVREHVPQRKDALLLAVARDEGGACLPRHAPGAPVQSVQEGLLSAPLETAQRHDLPRVKLQSRVGPWSPDPDQRRPPRRHHRRGGTALPGAVVSSAHQLDHVGDGGLVRLSPPHQPSVAEKRDGAGDLGDFLELVADEDEGGAFGGPGVDEVDQLSRPPRRKRRRRLVQDDQPHARRRGGPRDLDHLALAEGQGTDRGIGRDPVSGKQGVERGPRPQPVRRAPSGQRPRGIGGLDEEVLGHRQVGAERQFLVHHPDAVGLRRGGVMGAPGQLSVEQDLPCARRHHAAEDLHQGGLAGAVAADEADHFTRPDVEVDPVVRHGRAVCLADAAQGDQWRRCGLGRCGEVHRFRCDPWRAGADEGSRGGPGPPPARPCRSQFPSRFSCTHSSE